MNKGGRNNGIYAAETILKQRTKDGKVWYLMKWKGYSPRFNTWEPEENVLDDRLLKAYRKRIAESKGKVRKKRSRQTDGDGTPSEDKSGDGDADIEGGDSSNELEQEVLDDIPSTSADQPVADSPRKWRKRRKPNNPETPTPSSENDVENTEVKEAEQSTLLDVTMEMVQEEAPSEVNVPGEELEMTELSVQIPNVEQDVKCSPSPVVTTPKVSPSPLLIKTLETPPSTSTTSSPTAPIDATVPELTTPVETESPSSKISPNIVTTDSNLTSAQEDVKPEVSLQQEKKNLLSKSSHFDFLANSIIITDVTTDRGTVTVKECSAYGDFFGPEFKKSPGN